MFQPRIRVVVADDDRLFSQALLLTLALDGRFEVVAHAADGREAVELAAQHVPDIVLMDLHMPVLDGIEATRLVLLAAPGTRVVALSSSDLPEHVARARAAGAVAYLTKEGSSLALCDAVAQAAGASLRRDPVAPRETSRLDGRPYLYAV
jgi:DNA-binding NarL/FixJ family response regulator